MGVGWSHAWRRRRLTGLWAWTEVFTVLDGNMTGCYFQLTITFFMVQSRSTKQEQTLAALFFPSGEAPPTEPLSNRKEAAPMEPVSNGRPEAAAAVRIEPVLNREDLVSEEEGQGTGEEMVAQQGEEGPVTKKPRVEDEEEEEEEEALTILKRFRNNWLELMSPFVGPLEATTGTEFGPKHYTESGPPRSGGIDYDALEILSLKVTEIKEGLEWPLRVFGLVAVRDSMDYKRNILFHRSKENCQVLTAEDPFLELTGPSRAIALIDPPEFEVELRVIGSSPSEEKLFSAAIFRYINNSYSSRFAGQVQTRIVSTKRSTIEMKYSHLKVPLEATIEIHHSEGSSDFRGLFFAHMEYMGEEKIVLLNSSDCNVTVEPDGSIPLARCVVIVDNHAKLTVGVKAWQGENGQDGGVVRHVEFPAKLHSKSDGEFDVEFCKMGVSVYWSVLC